MDDCPRVSARRLLPQKTSGAWLMSTVGTGVSKRSAVGVPPAACAPVTISTTGQTTTLTVTGATSAGPMVEVGALPVFSQTGGLVGAELGVAGGTAVLAQRLLEAIFGEDAVRRLAKQAKTQLDGRVEALMARELTRYLAEVDAIDVRAEQAGLVVEAVEAVARVRPEVMSAASSPPASASELMAARAPLPITTGDESVTEPVLGVVLDPQETS